MSINYKTELEKRLHKLESEIKEIRVAADALSEPEAKSMLGRYLGAFLGHFNYWIAAGKLTARTPTAQNAFNENLREEISGDHPSMLYHFIQDANGLPATEDLAAIYPAVEEVNKQLTTLSPTKAALVSALLEATAVEDMQYLEKLATLRGSKNLEYTKVHGVADIEHSAQLIDGAVEEIQCYEKELAAEGVTAPQEKILKDMDDVTNAVGRLLKSIFTIPGRTR